MFHGPEEMPLREREPQRFTIETSQAVERGLKREEFNEPCEDNGFVSQEYKAAGVFDGLGGRKGGHEASRLANEATQEVISQGIAQIHDLTSAKQLLTRCFSEAHERVARESIKLTKTANADRCIATTGVVALIVEQEGKPWLVAGHVGDSRLYLLRNGKVEMLTIDDALWLHKSMPESLRARQQEIWSTIESRDDLPDDYDPSYPVPNSTITQALGNIQTAFPTTPELVDLREKETKDSDFEPSALNIHVLEKSLEPNDIVLLLTDGITDVLTLSRIAQSATKHSIQELPYALIRETRELTLQGHIRGKDDDAMAEVMKIRMK